MTNGDWLIAIVGALLGGGLLSFGRDWWKDHKAGKARTDEAPARIASMSIEGAGEAVELLRNALAEAGNQLEAQRQQIALQQAQISEQAAKIREQDAQVQSLDRRVGDLTAEVNRLTA